MIETDFISSQEIFEHAPLDIRFDFGERPVHQNFKSTIW
jgi:hypothetical protein